MNASNIVELGCKNSRRYTSKRKVWKRGIDEPDLERQQRRLNWKGSVGMGLTRSIKTKPIKKGSKRGNVISKHEWHKERAVFSGCCHHHCVIGSCYASERGIKSRSTASNILSSNIPLPKIGGRGVNIRNNRATCVWWQLRDMSLSCKCYNIILRILWDNLVLYLQWLHFILLFLLLRYHFSSFISHIPRATVRHRPPSPSLPPDISPAAVRRAPRYHRDIVFCRRCCAISLHFLPFLSFARLRQATTRGGGGAI